MECILITGGAGFIGSNFISNFLNSTPYTHVVNIDKLTYAGSLENLREVSDSNRYTFIKGDICDGELVKKVFETYAPRGVIHFAAESHVDNSISHPDMFVRTNVFGTFNLLNIAKNHWMDKPFKVKPDYKNARFIHISTDEVYGSLGEKGFFTELTPYAPNSPYSASKASSDMMVRSYFHTYGLNAIITNCSNNYGPKQHDEKLIPTVIRKAIEGKSIPIYGKGKNIRDWIYVDDHCKAVYLVFQRGVAGETYNIGSRNERTNIEIAEIICDILDRTYPKNRSYRDQISFVEDRPGHDFRYAINSDKIERHIGWKTEEGFMSSMEKTVDYYIKKYTS